MKWVKKWWCVVQPWKGEKIEIECEGKRKKKNEKSISMNKSCFEAFFSVTWSIKYETYICFFTFKTIVLIFVQTLECLFLVLVTMMKLCWWWQHIYLHSLFLLSFYLSIRLSIFWYVCLTLIVMFSIAIVMNLAIHISLVGFFF